MVHKQNEYSHCDKEKKCSILGFLRTQNKLITIKMFSQELKSQLQK